MKKTSRGSHPRVIYDCFMSWRRGLIAVVCAACGGQIAAPPPGAGGSMGQDGAATAPGGAATAMSAGGIAVDAGGKASDAEIVDAALEYCSACLEDGCVAGFEETVRMVPAPCTRALVKYVRCAVGGGCPSSTPAKAPPPGSGPCSDEELVYLNCLSSHLPMPP